MNDPVSRHPEAETMAAFLEGKLAPGAVAEVAAHLRDCADCRTVTGEAARFEEEERRFNAEPQRSPKSQWWIWAAAAAAAIVASVPLLRKPDPIQILIDASPREYRRVEGRLSGFRWARHQGGQRGTSVSPAEHELTSAAHDVLGRTTNDEAVEARHAAGVAHLLIDQWPASLEKLASAAGDSEDAGVWNDLAAARFTVAVREDRAALLPPALAAADRAIEIDPKLLDAPFNRASILEAMGLRNEARKAWGRYLELDPASGWSNEAREHLRKLGEPEVDLDFDRELARAVVDRDAIASLVRRFPQESRTYGEGPLLGEWANAVHTNDAARAEEKLKVIRAIGEELATAKRERLLLDVAQAVERSAARGMLAEAHLVHRDARIAYAARRASEAGERFREAEVLFRRARSPMADVAAAYLAKCTFDTTGEATEQLTALRARIDPFRHRALAADLDWALALQAVSAADWGSAARHTASASKTYSELGERLNAAWMDAFAAVALERVGAVDLAWRRRIAAVSAYTAPRQQRRLATILHSAALSLAAADDVPSAAAMMDVAIATGSNPEQQTSVLIDRARLAERADDVAVAHRWLSAARAEATRIEDDELREARIARIGLADAVLQRGSDPLRAIAALDRSIEYFQRHRQGIFLPDAILERARAHRAAGQFDAAASDYRAVLDEIDRQRANTDVSVEFLDVAARAIDDSIDLHLERGEAAEAFAIADRAHAMATNGYRPAPVPRGVALVQYAVLPHAIAIFCVTDDRIIAKRVPIERAALDTRVHSFAQKIRAREELRAEATALHALLIAPIASEIATARELVIVRDRQLNMVPFAALYDGAKYLIETHSIRVAPSAAATPPTANRQPFDSAQGRPPTGAIVISDPETDRAPRLPGSRREAENIAAIHAAAIIEGSDATRERVSEAFAHSSIVHYAGHADSDAGDSYGALLLASDGTDSGLLTSSEIARLDLRGHPLVVLSACGTLRGRTTHVAGMPSLARAFLGAGARAVAGTLWEVDDDVTGPLFLRFHKEVHDGQPVADALRAAQLEMLHSPDPRWSHPASWSAVEVLSNL
jgi:CHAT domain-containing protein